MEKIPCKIEAVFFTVQISMRSSNTLKDQDKHDYIKIDFCITKKCAKLKKTAKWENICNLYLRVNKYN